MLLFLQDHYPKDYVENRKKRLKVSTAFNISTSIQSYIFIIPQKL